MEQKSNYLFETEAIRTQMERSSFAEHSTPLHLTSSFVFEDAEEMRASFAEEKERNIYSRFSNPNTSEFVQKAFTRLPTTAQTRSSWPRKYIFSRSHVQPLQVVVHHPQTNKFVKMTTALTD